jgi:hypothetical protein
MLYLSRNTSTHWVPRIAARGREAILSAAPQSVTSSMVEQAHALTSLFHQIFKFRVFKLTAA